MKQYKHMRAGVSLCRRRAFAAAAPPVLSEFPHSVSHKTIPAEPSVTATACCSCSAAVPDCQMSRERERERESERERVA